jgi:hypothetical protein
VNVLQQVGEVGRRALTVRCTAAAEAAHVVDEGRHYCPGAQDFAWRGGAITIINNYITITITSTTSSSNSNSSSSSSGVGVGGGGGNSVRSAPTAQRRDKRLAPSPQVLRHDEVSG